MRGYFSIGSERISKPMNLGALMRTANAFGASYVFSIDADHRLSMGGYAPRPIMPGGTGGDGLASSRVPGRDRS